MGDVLSQNEIDNLLAALSTGELDVDEIKDNNEKKVKEYDFARPSKFSKEHLRTMEMIFEHYGRLLSTNLPVYLRKNVQVEVVNSEAVTYSEFSNALSNPVLLGIVNFAPLKGNIILEMASNLGYAIVDRMLGGRGDPMDKVREFSEIELLIIERIMIVCVNLLREPWENVADIHPRLERIETNSQYAQIISPSEMIASADGADARRKFFIRKRFYKVIVCTAVESFHTVIQLSKGCDHNDRSGNAFASGFLQNKKSVHGGQHAIQKNQVISILQNQIQPVASIHADLYCVVFFFQLKAQHFT